MKAPAPFHPGRGRRVLPLVQTRREGAGRVVENFLAERACLHAWALWPQGSGKSSKLEQVYHIPSFTHPALNFMENKIVKETLREKPAACLGFCLGLNGFASWVPAPSDLLSGYLGQGRPAPGPEFRLFPVYNSWPGGGGRDVKCRLSIYPAPQRDRESSV